MVTELLLIRHAQTALAGTFCGHLDAVLNERGREQMNELVQSLASATIDAVYSSDLQRALDVGTALATSKRLRCRSSAALREIDFGEWEGRDWQSVEARDAEIAAQWLRGFPNTPAPGGEEYRDFERRILVEIRALSLRPERTVAVVSHAGVLRVLLQHLAKLSSAQTWRYPIAFCSVLRLTRPDGSDTWEIGS